MSASITNLRELEEIKKPLELFKHLKTDLDKLKSQMSNLSNVKLSSKLLKGINLKKGDVPNSKILEFTGKRLSLSLNNPHIKELSERLQKNPEDSKSRLELVEIFLQESENSSLENARDAYLLAMLEVEMQLISTQKVNMALATQTVFLMKLQKFLQDELTKIETKIKDYVHVDTILQKQQERLHGHVDTIMEKQQKRVWGEVDFVQKCVFLLKYNPIEIDYELNLSKFKKATIIPFGDLKNGFNAMLSHLVLLPLANKNLELMFDILYRLESKNPLVGYHHSKMFDVLAQIELIIAGIVNDEEPRKKGFENLSNALNAISAAIKLVGDIPEKNLEKATVHRFGQLCYTIHQNFKSLNIPVQNDHLQRTRKAVQLLEFMSSDPKIKKLQGKLMSVLDSNSH
jgi:hypothetical protein